jgi:pseudouridine-5'-phosphate glycosidase
MAKESDGATLKANVALLLNNARVATEVARALVGERAGHQPKIGN